jgi:hypothetical protein
VTPEVLRSLIVGAETLDVEFKGEEAHAANYLTPLATGILERTIADKPRSRMQRYRTTEAGLVSSKEPERES